MGITAANVDGFAKPGYEPAWEAFVGNLERGDDVGASACLVVRGEVVLDVWGGHADADRTKPWERDTLVNVWSSTKTMMFLTCLVLMDRGELDPYERVAHYWPEFAANGKDQVQVVHLMSHMAGLSGWTEPITEADMWDHDKCASLLAAQAPWWEPGTASGYHALSQGYLLGELVRRVTGVSLGTFFAREIAGPMQADFHIGTPATCDDRVSLVIRAKEPLPPMEPGTIAERTFTSPAVDPTWAHSIGWRRCESPAANGHANARSMARAQAALSNGGEFNGVRLLSEATCRRVFEQQCDNVDLVLRTPARFGLGYGLQTPDRPLGPGAVFWGGWGGSLVLNDLDLGYTFTYAMNRMGEGTLGDTRAASILMGALPAIMAAQG